jgi:hypothetical protein
VGVGVGIDTEDPLSLRAVGPVVVDDADQVRRSGL